MNQTTILKNHPIKRYFAALGALAALVGAVIPELVFTTHLVQKRYNQSSARPLLFMPERFIAVPAAKVMITPPPRRTTSTFHKSSKRVENHTSRTETVERHSTQTVWTDTRPYVAPPPPPVYVDWSLGGFLRELFGGFSSDRNGGGSTTYHVRTVTELRTHTREATTVGVGHGASMSTTGGGGYSLALWFADFRKQPCLLELLMITGLLTAILTAAMVTAFKVGFLHHPTSPFRSQPMPLIRSIIFGAAAGVIGQIIYSAITAHNTADYGAFGRCLGLMAVGSIVGAGLQSSIPLPRRIPAAVIGGLAGAIGGCLIEISGADTFGRMACAVILSAALGYLICWDVPDIDPDTSNTYYVGEDGVIGGTAEASTAGADEHSIGCGRSTALISRVSRNKP